MKVAIVHDWLVSYGGAERCLEVFHELFPEAPVFTTVHDRSKLPDTLKDLDVRTSFIQRLPLAVKRYRDYLPLMPFAVRAFNLKGYDLILSSSHAVAKGIKKPEGALHVCYCYTPMRYAWDMYGQYMKYEKIGVLKRVMIPLVMPFLRLWDKSTAPGVDDFIAISKFVAGRIKRYYNRDSVVIYPPVETSRFVPKGASGDYYLALSRLVPLKRTDIIVEAFNELGLPLKVVGTGRDEEKLRQIAKSNIEFLGFRSDEELSSLVSGCKALVFASKEDFGIVPAEAQSAGRPVIVFGGGGASETVIPGRTGVIFEDQTKDSLAGAVRSFLKMNFDPEECRASAKRFDRELFKNTIKEFLLSKYNMRRTGK